MNLEFCPGKERLGSLPINIIIDRRTYPIIKCQIIKHKLVLNKGLNDFLIEINDLDSTPTIIGGDPRDLKVKIKVLGFSSE